MEYVFGRFAVNVRQSYGMEMFMLNDFMLPAGDRYLISDKSYAQETALLQYQLRSCCLVGLLTRTRNIEDEVLSDTLVLENGDRLEGLSRISAIR